MKEETTRVLDTRIDQMYEHFHGIAGNYAKGAKEVPSPMQKSLVAVADVEALRGTAGRPREPA